MHNPLTPLRFLERAASVHPNRTAIIDGPRTFTYAAMAAQVNRLAHALQARGLQPGDRVAYLAPNCAEMLVAHFAVPLAGGVLVTINTRLSAEEIARHRRAFRRRVPGGRRPAAGARAARSSPPSPRLREIVTLPAETGDAVEAGLHHRLRRPARRRQRRPDRPTRWPTRTTRSA